MNNTERERANEFDTNSKFNRTFLVIIAAVLIFIGPTYMVYLISDFAGINYAESLMIGFALLVAGLVLLWHLSRKRLID